VFHITLMIIESMYLVNIAYNGLQTYAVRILKTKHHERAEIY